MANHSSRGRPGRSGKRAAVPSFTEPEVRRWPHPVDGVAPTGRRSGPGSRQESGAAQTPGGSVWPAISDARTDPALYYIHCALSYQNQLLADIKALLEQLAADSAPVQEE